LEEKSLSRNNPLFLESGGEERKLEISKEPEAD
jgi:hypothetical protein